MQGLAGEDLSITLHSFSCLQHFADALSVPVGAGECLSHSYVTSARELTSATRRPRFAVAQRQPTRALFTGADP